METTFAPFTSFVGFAVCSLVYILSIFIMLPLAHGLKFRATYCYHVLHLHYTRCGIIDNRAFSIYGLSILLGLVFVGLLWFFTRSWVYFIGMLIVCASGVYLVYLTIKKMRHFFWQKYLEDKTQEHEVML